MYKLRRLHIMRYETDDRVAKTVSIEHYMRLVKRFYICRALHTKLINTLKNQFFIKRFFITVSNENTILSL